MDICSLAIILLMDASCNEGGALLNLSQAPGLGMIPKKGDLEERSMKKQLTEDALKKEAAFFARTESRHREPRLYGVTDGKAVGTYLEHKFREQINRKYATSHGSSAKGIDFPDINVDLKVTSIRQPQSSCPFDSARQKVFGLGYSLLVFVYEKNDDSKRRASTLNILHVIFVNAESTADFTMTRRLRQMVKDGANEEDIISYLNDRHLPVDDLQARQLAREILKSPPPEGCLTISNALQWRLQYSHAIQEAGKTAGVTRLV